MNEPIYEVFARKTREEPLRHIGYLNAPGEELARVYAWKTYDEESWFEMCVIPRDAIVAVNRDGGPFKRDRPPGSGDGSPDTSPSGGSADSDTGRGEGGGGR